MQCIINNSIKHRSLLYTQLNFQIVLFQTVQLSISHLFALCLMLNSSVWPINRTLSGATTPGHSWSGSDGNEAVLCIPQSSSITGASSSDCLMSYPGHCGGGLTRLQRCRQRYSTALVDCDFYWCVTTF